MHDAGLGHDLDVGRPELSGSEEAAFHLAGDIGIVAAGGGRARARDLQLVDYGLDLRDLANDFFNLRLGLRGGHFAREQHRVVVAGDVDVSLALERFVDAVARRAFDPVIVEHDLELTAVGGENHPRRHAADDKGVDARLKRGDRDNEQRHGGPPPWCAPASHSAPSSIESMPSHRQCRVSRCTSCMRAVWECGTQMFTSSGESSLPVSPPPRPVRATTRMR